MHERYWTEVDTARAVRLSRQGYQAKTIARVIDRSEVSVKIKLSNLKNMELEHDNDYYYQGRTDRAVSKPKCAPNGLMGPDKYAWLAGWHDKDMELGVSVLEGVA